MKQKFNYLSLFLPLLAFVLLGACTDKDEALRAGDATAAVSFHASLGQRGFTRGTLDHEFGGTEQIAVTMRANNVDSWPTVRRYVASTTGALTHSADVTANPDDLVAWRWPDDADAIDVKGWHTADLYRTAVNGQVFSVPTDQSQRSTMQGYDFLYAPATTHVDPTAASVPVDLWHQLCLVRIYIDSGVDLTDAASTVRLFGTQWTQRAIYTEPTSAAKLYGAWDTYSGTFTPQTAFTEGVTPLYIAQSNDGKKALFAALMIPQQTRGRQLITLTLLGGTYTYTLPATEEASPDFLPGMVYTYSLRLKDNSVTFTANPWEAEAHPNFTTTPNPWNPWEGVDENSATYVNATRWLKSDNDENIVTPNPWLPSDDILLTGFTDVDFWIVNWLKEDTTAVLDYVTLRKATDKDSIPVQVKDTLMYTSDGWYIYSHGGGDMDGLSYIGGGFSSPVYTTRTEGYTEWAILEWERNQVTDLIAKNTATNGPWAFRVDDNSRLKNKTINVLRLKSASTDTGTKTIRLYKKAKNTAFDLTDTPDATASFTAKSTGEEVIAKLSTPLTLGDYEYLVIDAPANTFYYNDDYKEAFYGYANTSSWHSFGASLGIDVGYLADPVTDGEGTWYITSCKDNGTTTLTDSREAAASTFAGYVYPLTMQARLRGHAFNAFRFLRKDHGSFTVYAVKRDGTHRTLGTVTVSADDETTDEQALTQLLVTRYLKGSGGNVVSATLADDEYLVIGGGLSNWYSATGGTFSDYNNSTYYLYGLEGYYTIPSTSAWGTWTWDGNQYGLLGVDVGYVE